MRRYIKAVALSSCLFLSSATVAFANPTCVQIAADISAAQSVVYDNQSLRDNANYNIGVLENYINGGGMFAEINQACSGLPPGPDTECAIFIEDSYISMLSNYIDEREQALITISVYEDLISSLQADWIANSCTS